MNCALSKIAPIDGNVPRRLGMRQFFTEDTEWKALAGETFADYSDYDSGTGRPKMKPWPTLPKRPDPGAEPRFQPPGKDEDLSAAMAKLSQLHKEWETSRQDLKQCEAASHVRAASRQSSEAHGRILRRLTSWKRRSAEWRMSPGPALHTLSNIMAKPLCLHAARLAPANRQALEELVPKLLQILLHAESPALLFC